MVRKPFLLKLFNAATIQRWNDKVRPMEFTELDKQAHKMVIAYFLGKFEENHPDFDWIKIIEGGIFELLQRIVLTDLKPPIIYKIKTDPHRYQQLNQWVANELSPVLGDLGEPFVERFANYFSASEDNINRRILSAAHFYATKFEFNIIERFNPDGYENEDILQDLKQKQEKYSDLNGIKALMENLRYKKFLDLCGQLRFQKRWSNLHRIPQTSVMGHMLFVAIVSYLFSMEIGACRCRMVNNYFTGLFHDLPEVLTRDIISPIKRSVEGLDTLLKAYEIELMNKDVYSLLPLAWHDEFRLFTEYEFANILNNQIVKDLTCDEINQNYNDDRYCPRDGHLVKAADLLGAYIEAYLAISNGSSNPDLFEAKHKINFAYQNEFQTIGGIDFRKLYVDFD